MNKCDFIQSKTSMTLSSRFKNFNQRDAKPNVFPMPYKNINNSYNYGNSKKKFCTKRKFPSHETDLRTLLTSKRKNFTSDEKQDYRLNQLEEYSSNSFSQVSYQPPPLNISNYHNLNDDWARKENMLAHSTAPKIDTTPLRLLLHVENFNPWYIVSDCNVFLNHVDFINIIVMSDSQCRLMIPQQVMNKIKLATSSRLRTQAHKAEYFISEKIDLNIAYVDKEDTEDKVIYKDAITHCCLRLMEQGDRVILLTDDIELHSTECSFPMYTVSESKKILNNPQLHTVDSNSCGSFPGSKNCNIKITIPNDDASLTNNTSQRIDKNEINEHINTERDQFANEGESYYVLLNEENDVTLECNEEINDLELLQAKDADGVTNNSLELATEQTNPHITHTSNKAQATHNTEFNNMKVIKLKRHHTFDAQKKSEPTSNRICHRTRAKSNSSIISENSIRSKKNDLQTTTLSSLRSESVYNDANSTLQKVSETETIHSELNQSKKYIESREPRAKHDESHTNVMFEVTSRAMEDNLNMKCDEWISRFVQIMEEVLSQTLQIDPPYILDTMPPPWNIYEAVECVKRKFTNDTDICDAAIKMSDVLFEIGALRGKIKSDISPSKFMEMYSYGVYLIDTLQACLNNLEDLQTAEQSLAKLLKDIQDPHLDTTNQELFVDNPESRALQLNNVSVESIEPVNNKIPETQTEYSSPNIRSSVKTSSPLNTYRLRSQKNTLEEPKEPVKEVMFIRNIDLKSTFLTFFNLKKKDIKCNGETTGTVTDGVATDNETSNLLGNTNHINNSQNEDDTEANKASTEPKIIRNFTKCMEFEEKLQNEFLEKNVQAHNDWYNKTESDYATNEVVDHETEYFMDDDYDDFSFDDDVDDYVNEKSEQNIETADRRNGNYKLLFGKIESEIKRMLRAVYTFCIKSSETLLSPKSDITKANIRAQAEDTFLHINSICDALCSILTKEAGNFLLRIQKLFSIEGINENVDKKDFEEYKILIEKCLEQGRVLRDSVKLVIDASKE